MAVMLQFPLGDVVVDLYDEGDLAPVVPDVTHGQHGGQLPAGWGAASAKPKTAQQQKVVDVLTGPAGLARGGRQLNESVETSWPQRSREAV